MLIGLTTEAKVSDFDIVAITDQNVFGFQIAMHDSGFVYSIKSVYELFEVVPSNWLRKSPESRDKVVYLTMFGMLQIQVANSLAWVPWLTCVIYILLVAVILKDVSMGGDLFEEFPFVFDLLLSTAIHEF